MESQASETIDTADGSLGRRAGKWLVRGGIAFGTLIVLFFVVVRILDEPRPVVTPSPAADELARSLMAAVDVDAWQRTGAVAWKFGGRREHLWDRERQFARVVWDNQLVLLDLDTRMGIAVVDGREVQGEERVRLEKEAWAHWCNDSFWLNPIAKLFDEGTTRGLVDVEEGRGLAILYGSGGVTPGDLYVWHVGDDGLPTHWRMWTTILPVGGVEAGWDDWVSLPTGAKVATRHKIAFLELELTDVVAGPSLSAIVPGGDPFAPLVPRQEELTYRTRQEEARQRQKVASLTRGRQSPVPPEQLQTVIRLAAGAVPEQAPPEEALPEALPGEALPEQALPETRPKEALPEEALPEEAPSEEAPSEEAPSEETH